MDPLNPDMPGYRNPKTTLEKMFVLIDLLKYKRRKSYAELASLLDKSERQIRRDIQTLEGFFHLDYDEYGRPFILTDLHQDELMIPLTAEEMAYLKKLVQGGRDKLKNSLIKKLDLNLSLDLEFRKNYAELLDLIQVGINKKIQLVLKGYTSGSSGLKRDRLVEPIAITELKYLTAFDVEDQKNKNFNLERLEDAELTYEAQEFMDLHKHLVPDPFGMVTGQSYKVEMLLTHRAYLLMCEEYPRCKVYLEPATDHKFSWMFSGWVNGLEGVGRFILGLPGEVRINYSDDLKKYVLGARNNDCHEMTM